jgi:uncharacterized protein (TIGR02452 family)
MERAGLSFCQDDWCPNALSAAERLVVEREAKRTLCLNFASARHPGGGFLKGAQAQEESLARSSALYASLLTQPKYYEANLDCGTALYTDHMILSPDVAVFRRDSGALLPKAYLCSFLTAPAVNAGAVLTNEPKNRSQILPTMARRIDMVLAVALHHGYDNLILGAWGCGVFKNDPSRIADLFAAALLKGGSFENHFHHVAFAVLDISDTRQIFRPFAKRFERS